MEFKEKVVKIQTELKAPKSKYNKFGDYNYRNAESILEAAKSHLKELGLVLTLTDDIIVVGEHKPIEWKHQEYDKYKKKEVEVVNIFSGQRFYIKAFATLTDTKTDEKVTVSALARESEVKKGMDESQITGAASSYARKYALNGLFLLDDTKDADTDEHQKETTVANKTQQNKSELSVAEIKVARDLFIKNKWNEKQLLKGKTIEQLTSKEYGEVMRKIAEKEGK